MSEVVNPNKEAIQKIPVMTLAELQKTIEASTAPLDANDNQKQRERAELHSEAKKRLEVLKQSGANEQLDLLEQKIKIFQQAPNSPAQAPSTVAVAPSTPATPPNIVEKFVNKGMNRIAQVLNYMPLTAEMKQTVLQFLASFQEIPVLGTVLPRADLVSDLGKFTLVFDELKEFAQKNPAYTFSNTISAEEWKEYKEHLKKDPSKTVMNLLTAFTLEAKKIPASTQKIVLSLKVLMQPAQTLEPMKVAVETSLVSAIQKAWGVKTVEFKDGAPSLHSGTLTVRKSDIRMNGEPVANSEAMELHSLMSKFGNVDIALSSDPAITISWNGEKKAITLPKGTKNSLLETLQEILRQNKNSKFSHIVFKDNDKLGDNVATLSYSTEGVGTLTAPMNERMLKALTQFRSLQPSEGNETKWKLDGTTLKLVTQGVNMKKEDAPKVS